MDTDRESTKWNEASLWLPKNELNMKITKETRENKKKKKINKTDTTEQRRKKWLFVVVFTLKIQKFRKDFVYEEPKRGRVEMKDEAQAIEIVYFKVRHLNKWTCASA